jgi:SAM-dependent methyltransferase
MHFICADLKSRPFEKDFFDQVLFAGTAHHLTDALYAEMLSELHFCLKPGGIIHILDPVLQSKDGWQERLLRRVDRGRYPRTTERLIDLVPPGLFQIGAATYHTPYGALMQDCDFIHFSLTKRT